jgi:pimeloyl-ACP methyl ester carboxylesterase
MKAGTARKSPGEKREPPPKDPALSGVGRRGAPGQHRRARISPTRRARSVGDDPGSKRDQPPLILLHGGPGLSETRFFRLFNAPLENTFTVVYWDQRGAGKSFSRHVPRSSMTIEQFIADLDELVDGVCQRLEKKKVAIFGHSWGSALGSLFAHAFPRRLQPTSAADSTGTPLPARRRPTRSGFRRRSVAASAGR